MHWDIEALALPPHRLPRGVDGGCFGDGGILYRGRRAGARRVDADIDHLDRAFGVGVAVDALVFSVKCVAQLRLLWELYLMRLSVVADIERTLDPLLASGDPFLV